MCVQVLQAQVESLVLGEGALSASLSQAEEALSGEACAAGLQAEQQLQQRLGDLTGLRLTCEPQENDQLDLILETDGMRKSIHNLGTIVTTR